jgi:ribosomal protein L19E
MTRILAVVVLGASMILTTAAAFAESNSAMDREPVRQLIEQPATEALDVAVVSGAPGQTKGPFYEQRLDNIDHASL